MEGPNLSPHALQVPQQPTRGCPPSTMFPFLALLSEIRVMVYRLLLVDNKSLHFVRNDIHLHPSILRTCRQVLNESRIILYSENIWSMRIWDKEDEPRAYFLSCDHFAKDAEWIFGPRLQDMKRFEISVEIKSEDEVLNVKAIVRDVCNVLSSISNLDYLHLKLDGRGFDAQLFPRVLESFTLLRNVNRVILENVPPVYAQYLRDRITGYSPLHHLPRMYEALEFYAGHFDCCEDLLQEAYAAMEDDDSDRFSLAREGIITMVNEYMTNAHDHLFDHDASS